MIFHRIVRRAKVPADEKLRGTHPRRAWYNIKPVANEQHPFGSMLSSTLVTVANLRT